MAKCVNNRYFWLFFGIGLLFLVTLCAQRLRVMQPVDGRNPPQDFVVVASYGETYIPLLLYEFSGSVCKRWPLPIFKKLRSSPDFDQYIGGVKMVCAADMAAYRFDIPVHDIEKIEYDLNHLPSFFHSTATYGIEINSQKNGCACDITLYQSTNGTNCFRYITEKGSVKPVAVRESRKMRFFIVLCAIVFSWLLFGIMLSLFGIKSVRIAKQLSAFRGRKLG